MTNYSKEKAENFYDILEEQDFDKVIEVIEKELQPFLFRCIDAAINMIETKRWEDSQLFCLETLSDLIAEYKAPAVAPLNTKYGIAALKKALKIDRSKVKEIVVLCLKICSSDLERKCISLIADFYSKEFLTQNLTSNRFPHSIIAEKNRFTEFYLELEKLSSNIENYEKEELEDKKKKLKQDYGKIKQEGDISEMEDSFANFEFKIIEDYLESLRPIQNQSEGDQPNSLNNFRSNDKSLEVVENAQNQSEENRSDTNDHTENKLSTNPKGFEPVGNKAEENLADLKVDIEKSKLNNNSEDSELAQSKPEEDQFNFNDDYEEIKEASEKPSIQSVLNSEFSAQRESDKKEVSALPTLGSKKISEEIKDNLENQSSPKTNPSVPNDSDKKVEPPVSPVDIPNDFTEFPVHSKSRSAVKAETFDPIIQASCGQMYKHKSMYGSSYTSTN